MVYGFVESDKRKNPDSSRSVGILKSTVLCFSFFLSAILQTAFVGRLGFEPGMTEPKPVVLPLHHRPVYQAECSRLLSKSAAKVMLFFESAKCFTAFLLHNELEPSFELVLVRKREHRLSFLSLNHDLTHAAVAHTDDVQTLLGSRQLAAIERVAALNGAIGGQLGSGDAV